MLTGHVERARRFPEGLESSPFRRNRPRPSVPPFCCSGMIKAGAGCTEHTGHTKAEDTFQCILIHDAHHGSPCRQHPVTMMRVYSALSPTHRPPWTSAPGLLLTSPRAQASAVTTATAHFAQPRLTQRPGCRWAGRSGMSRHRTVEWKS